jgi:hypothetical protein
MPEIVVACAASELQPRSLPIDQTGYPFLSVFRLWVENLPK